MKRLLIILSLISFVALLTWSCEKDDICPADTPTTPHLIIRFYDISDQDEFKNVRQLTIAGLNDDDSVGELIPVNTTNPDSIVLPLRFQNENIETVSRFQLIKDSDYATNDNPDDEPNIDVIEVRYTPEFVYVSRACGYKSVFDLSPPGGISKENDGDNWITSFEIINERIEDEFAAQVIIYH